MGGVVRRVVDKIHDAPSAAQYQVEWTALPPDAHRIIDEIVVKVGDMVEAPAWSQVSEDVW